MELPRITDSERHRMRNEQVSILKTDKHRDFVIRTLRKGEKGLLDGIEFV